MQATMDKTQAPEIERSLIRSYNDFTEDDWPAEAVRGKTVPHPMIGFHEVGEYSLPSELYAKLLINSPISFGTVSVIVDDETDETGMRGLGYDIDIAVHPHYGVLVCGAVFTRPGKMFQDLVKEELQVARETRAIMQDLFSEIHELDRHTVPVGIFLTLLAAERSDLPAGIDTDGVWFCTKSEFPDLPARMVAAMEKASALSAEAVENGEDEFYEYGARVLASLPGLRPQSTGASYTSGLELLMNLGLI